MDVESVDGSLVERDANSGMVTTWLVEPVAGNRSRVRATTTWGGAGGIGGLLERAFAPAASRGPTTACWPTSRPSCGIDPRPGWRRAHRPGDDGRTSRGRRRPFPAGSIREERTIDTSLRARPQ